MILLSIYLAVVLFMGLGLLSITREPHFGIVGAIMIWPLLPIILAIAVVYTAWSDVNDREERGFYDD